MHCVQESQDACLLSAIGRWFLCIGNLSRAESLFSLVNSSTAEPIPKNLALTNRGLLGFAQGSYSTAGDCFHEVLQTDRSNPSAMSNLAVCRLFAGNLREAIHILEGFLSHSDSQTSLTDRLLFNLCTMYELEGDSALTKKKHLLRLVASSPTTIDVVDALSLKLAP